MLHGTVLQRPTGQRPAGDEPVVRDAPDPHLGQGTERPAVHREPQPGDHVWVQAGPRLRGDDALGPDRVARLHLGQRVAHHVQHPAHPRVARSRDPRPPRRPQGVAEDAVAQHLHLTLQPGGQPAGPPPARAPGEVERPAEMTAGGGKQGGDPSPVRVLRREQVQGLLGDAGQAERDGGGRDPPAAARARALRSGRRPVDKDAPTLRASSRGNPWVRRWTRRGCTARR